MHNSCYLPKGEVFRAFVIKHTGDREYESRFKVDFFFSTAQVLPKMRRQQHFRQDRASKALQSVSRQIRSKVVVSAVGRHYELKQCRVRTVYLEIALMKKPSTNSPQKKA